MKAWAATILGLLAMSCASPAAAIDGHASGHCDGGTHVVTGAGQYDPSDGEIAGMLFLRQAVGVCLPDEIVPDEPVPVEIYDRYEQGQYVGTAFLGTAAVPAPAVDAVYRYVPLIVRPDGTRERMTAVGWGWPPYTLITCSDLPFLRGTIGIDPVYAAQGYDYYTFLPCEENCWTEQVWNIDYSVTGLEDLLGAPIAELEGRTVDVYGGVASLDLVPGVSHWITRVELNDEAGCGSVPDAPTSWGGLKAMYR